MTAETITLPAGWRTTRGVMADLVARMDWAQTPLGPQQSWPASLRFALSTILGASFPMALRWGPDFTLIYNDAYAPILGDKHPWALGRPAREAWAEVWPEIAPVHQAILEGRAASLFSEDMALRITRKAGTMEDARFTLGYSPIAEPSAPCGVGGILIVAVEITGQAEAAEALRASEERYELALRAAGTIGTWDWDIPRDRVTTSASFATLYSVDPEQARAGTPIANFIAGIHPEDRSRVTRELSDSLATLGDFASEYRLQLQDGGVVWVAARGRVQADEDGRPVRLPGATVDITQRKRIEEALRESRGFMQDLLKSSSEAFYAVDRDGRTTLCNAAFLRMHGFAHEQDVLGRQLHDLIHHTHTDGSHYHNSDCPIYICARTGEPAHVDTEIFYRLNGEAFPVEYWVSPVYRDGVHSGAICNFIDITARRGAEAELARREAEFRTLAQAAPAHVWAARPDGMLDWCNDRSYEYAGAAPGSLDGAAWLGVVHPDDQAEAGRLWRAALASGDAYQSEFRLRRADGAYRWHISRALPIRGESGAIQLWIGTNTDIDDERRALQSLASLNATLEQRVAQESAERDRLWQTSQDLLCVIGSDGIIRAANPAWAATLGWRPEDVAGRSHLDLVHEDDRAISAAAFAQVLAGPAAPSIQRYRHQDGSIRWISWIATAEAGAIYASGRNITAERQAGDELARAQEALRQSQKMEAVGQLTGGIAHDFNNMLAVVIGSLELLGRRLSGGDARAQRYLDSASEGAKRAALLTQRLLAFSRQQSLKPEAIDINRLVAGMSDLLRHSIGADIRLETVLAGGMWRTHADPNQLENIILNLAVNARDAMPEGGRLTIETQNAHLDERYVAAHPGLAAGQYALIAVSDTGCGMAPDTVEKAFDPFFTTKPVGKGTGLGLSQVYGFVKQSGGHVKIYSEAGRGTTIKIYLPRLTGAAEDSQAEHSIPALALGDARDVILVVEDEPAVRRFSIDALTELGYKVLEADCAESALRLLDTHPEIVLLFTDIVMPDINGARLAQEAQRRRPDLRVLFTTGYTRNAVVHNGVLDPGVDMIGKPYTLDALAAKLRLVLERS